MIKKRYFISYKGIRNNIVKVIGNVEITIKGKTNFDDIATVLCKEKRCDFIQITFYKLLRSDECFMPKKKVPK